MKTTAFLFILCICLFEGELRSQVPNLVNYQGRVAVGAVNFEGMGQFKFALVNASGTTSFWSNDDTSASGSEPAAAVSLTVTKGLYSVLLGDVSVANMSVIPSSVWSNADVRLRIWFNDGTNGSQLLTPDQRITPNGYLPDGTVTSEKMASNLALVGTVTAERFVASAAESPANVFPVNGMVWIKPGSFLMGSRNDEIGRDTDESPQMMVTLTKGFWIGCHEVTQAEYQAVTGSNPSFHLGDTNRPVERVSWSDAEAYCVDLTTIERTAGQIPVGWGYRLPTEAEWEYCCRAGASTARFGYGDDLSSAAFGSYAWYSVNSGSVTHPVEQKIANPWGLMDMHGNVFEWCQGWYAAYPGGAVTDPLGPASGTRRPVRGGGWDRSAAQCRSAGRNFNTSGVPTYNVGFRIVLSSGQP
jgi:formylglycine-generating enzyme required for sulfatase activity